MIFWHLVHSSLVHDVSEEVTRKGISSWSNDALARARYTRGSPSCCRGVTSYNIQPRRQTRSAGADQSSIFRRRFAGGASDASVSSPRRLAEGWHSRRGGVTSGPVSSVPGTSHERAVLKVPSVQRGLPALWVALRGSHVCTGFRPNCDKASSRPVPHTKNQRLMHIRQVAKGVRTEFTNLALLPGRGV